MPAQAKGARLWLRKARRDGRGKITHPAVWLILDGKHQESTECGPDDVAGAEAKLEAYLNRRHTKAVTENKRVRAPDQIPVADVLALYAAQVAPTVGRPKEYAAKIERLLAFFGDKLLSDVNGNLCRAFVAQRSTRSAAREDLVVLRAAINHHREEGHCAEIVSVVLPEKAPRRERWCTRPEIARLVWSAWRYREIQKGEETDRRSRRHVARFILVAVYTGTRAGAVCAAALEPTEGKGFIDLDRGVFYRRPAGERETKKRKPPVPLPRRLLGHLRRWHAAGQAYAVEWNGEPVASCKKAFHRLAQDAGLPDVTPHVLRHTAATWLMQLGTDPVEAAGFLGMTLQTLMDNYFHHHPDYLTGARDAFDYSPEDRKSANALPKHRREKGVKTPSNVTKIASRFK